MSYGSRQCVQPRFGSYARRKWLLLINAAVATDCLRRNRLPQRDQGGVIRRRAQPDVLEEYQRSQVGGAMVAVAIGATVVIAIAGAVPILGVTDARPEMVRSVAVEDRTAGAYETVRDRFTANRRGLHRPRAAPRRPFTRGRRRELARDAKARQPRSRWCP